MTSQSMQLRVDVLLEFERQWLTHGHFNTTTAACRLGITYRALYRTLNRLREGGVVHLAGADWRAGSLSVSEAVA